VGFGPSETTDKAKYTKTCNLFQCEFPLRAGQSKFDPLNFWERVDLYTLAMKLNETNQKFVLHDGPPYANGPLHMGHVMNKVVKDALVKYKRLQGYHCPFVPGWDCHGLPIEHKVTTSPPEDLLVMDVPLPTNDVDDGGRDVRKRCRKYAEYWVSQQLKEFQQLGVLADWSHAYHSMDSPYEAETLRVFSHFVNAGLVEWKLKTVPWCASCTTTLSKAEMEYLSRLDPSAYVAFSLTSSSLSEFLTLLPPEVAEVKRVSLVAWTTTPWTLPLNQAVALSPRGSYVLARFKADAEHVAVVGAGEFRSVRHLLKLEGEFSISSQLSY